MYHLEILFFLRLAHRLSLISYYTCIVRFFHDCECSEKVSNLQVKSSNGIKYELW